MSYSIFLVVWVMWIAVVKSSTRLRGETSPEEAVETKRPRTLKTNAYSARKL